MKQFTRRTAGIGVALLLGGCASMNGTVSSTINSTSDINADINGNPSAVALNIFELTTPGQFEKSDFMALYTHPSTALGSTLVAEKSVMLAPDTQETVSLPAVKGGAYLAYVVAYRDLTHSTWSLVVPVDPLPLIGASVTVMVSANGISLSQ